MTPPIALLAALLAAPAAAPVTPWSARRTAARAEAEDARAFTFAVVGHLRGDRTGELLQNFDELLAELARLRPDLLFLTGDIVWGDVDGEATDAAAVERDWERVDERLAALGIPVHRVPGNHDINDGVTRDLFLERYGPLPAVVTRGTSRFLLLSSAWIPADGDDRKHPAAFVRGRQLGPDQVAFVAEQLASGSEHVFVFLHHMLWWEEGAAWWSDVHPLLAAAQVRAVFAGDWGPLKFSHLERDGVHYLQTSVSNPTWLPMLRAREASRVLEAQFDNFLLVTVDGPEVRYEVRTLGALSGAGFTPGAWRDVHAYDRGSLARRIHDRLGSPAKLLAALAKVAGAAGAVGLALGAALGWLLARRRAGSGS